MAFNKIFITILLIIYQTHFSGTITDDVILYKINWPGSNMNFKDSSTQTYRQEDAVIVNTANNEKYKCMIPSDSQKSDESMKSERASSPVELLSPLLSKKTCTYRLEAYWTYELCHGKHIRQYHEEKVAGGVVKLQEFYLGYFDEEQDESGLYTALSADNVPMKKIDGVPTPFFAVEMTGGSPCGLKGGEKRKTKVLYVCHPDSRNEIMSVTETSTCEYELVILTPVLCKNPAYKVKGSPVNEIYCTALDGSPVKPVALTEEIYEMASNLNEMPQVEKEQEEDSEGEPTRDDYRRVEGAGISKQTDNALLKEFLSGDFCLKGGSGWWKYEYCYGRHVRQYHDDKELGRTIINVGLWDEAAHMKWTKTNNPRLYKDEVDPTSKKVTKKVRMVQHFYHNGDYCDEVKKPREVVVKLKCKHSSSPHAVTIYLLEPKTCSYVLGVESPIICDLLDTADKDGLFILDM